MTGRGIGDDANAIYYNVAGIARLEKKSAEYMFSKYVADTSLRLNYYKRMAQAESDDQVYDVLQEMTEFYGSPPEAVERLT